MKDLTKGKILPLLLGFAVPIAVGNIFQLFTVWQIPGSWGAF